MDLKPAGARSYEPNSLLPGATFENAMLLLEFYQISGNKKFLNQVPAAIAWLESTRLPEEKTQNGRYTHSTFIEVDTNRPIYVHRKGSNVTYGYYYNDYNDDHLLSHYGGKTRIPIDKLKQEYSRLNALTLEELTADSPLAVGEFARDTPPQKFNNLNRVTFDRVPDQTRVKEIINSLDDMGRWLMTGGMTSNPYLGDGQKQELGDEYASLNVGDETDTSPYRDTTGQEYLSTGKYIMNMKLLVNFIESEK